MILGAADGMCSSVGHALLMHVIYQEAKDVRRRTHVQHSVPTAGCHSILPPGVWFSPFKHSLKGCSACFMTLWDILCGWFQMIPS